MSFFKQQKLLKSEWISLERKLDTKDINVLKIIQNGYHDSNICHDFHNTLRNLLKINDSLDDAYIFKTCYGDKYKKSIQKTKCKLFQNINFKGSDKKAKKSDIIRIENTMKTQKDIIDKSIESVILNIIFKIIKNTEDKEYWCLSLHNIITKNHHLQINNIVLELSICLLETAKKEFSDKTIKYILKNSNKCVDNNKYNSILPIKLYDHQCEIYNIFKNQQEPKLIYYTAPTSSGKTLTPVGLSEQYKIIFLCASKHIGLQLAKNLVNVQKKIAFSFGCDDVSQIRLHNNAASTFIETKYGKKIDNTDGKNVDIIISDIKSYEIAMLYMLAYSQRENIILFWDEPTIMLDKICSDHHEMMQNVCKINKIPNVILSSATLPPREYLADVESSFMRKFGSNSKVFTVTNCDTISNICLVDECGNVVMPHTYFESFDSLQSFLKKDIKKYYKFFSCQYCSKFILFYCKHKSISLRRLFDNYDSLCSTNIKDVYFDILKSMNDSYWRLAYDSFNMMYKHKIDNIGTKITAEHGASLVHGPTLYICENTKNVMKYLYTVSKISNETLSNIESNIEYNENILEKIKEEEQKIEFELSKKSNADENDSGKDKINYSLSDNSLEKYQQQLDKLNKSLKTITLPYIYIPNTKDHYLKYHPNHEYSESDIFTCVLDETVVQNILKLDINNIYKILLLQGIGVFSTYKPNNDYNVYESLVKQLADEKELFVVIADSDYIFGVNYQFCHCYLGKDLSNITHEKIIQAIGRVGRKERNKSFTFRFRSQHHINEFFNGSNNNCIEVVNINKLFIF